MPGLISRLNCFSNSRKRDKRRRFVAEEDDGRGPKRSSIASIGRTTSSSPTSHSDGGVGVPDGLCLNDRVRRDDDNSIPTMDSDYKQVNAGNYSLSDAGGTISSQNNQSLTNFSRAESAYGSMANVTADPSAFGISSPTGFDFLDRRDSVERRPSGDPYGVGSPRKSPSSPDEMLEIYAPGGKLGLVIDAPDHAFTPVVHAIKDTCPIRDQICVGDHLVAVDDVDVREMSAQEVSRLIGKKSGQDRRKLTIIRSGRGRDGMY
ncbi:hypothetical protein ACHAWF_015348 [Thalassiosira exigua]